MKVQNWHMLNTLVNFALLVVMIILALQRNVELLDVLIRVGIVAVIQGSWNLLMLAIPRFFPAPQPRENHHHEK